MIICSFNYLAMLLSSQWTTYPSFCHPERSEAESRDLGYV